MSFYFFPLGTILFIKGFFDKSRLSKADFCPFADVSDRLEPVFKGFWSLPDNVEDFNSHGFHSVAFSNALQAFYYGYGSKAFRGF